MRRLVSYGVVGVVCLGWWGDGRAEPDRPVEMVVDQACVDGRVSMRVTSDGPALGEVTCAEGARFDGEMHLEGRELTAIVDATGDDDLARVAQRGTALDALVVQEGTAHQACVAQEGADDVVDLAQWGNDHFGSVLQEGSGNQLTATQDGSWNTYAVLQIGSFNTGYLSQVGSGHLAFARMFGDGNTFTIVQEGERDALSYTPDCADLGDGSRVAATRGTLDTFGDGSTAWALHEAGHYRGTFAHDATGGTRYTVQFAHDRDEYWFLTLSAAAGADSQVRFALADRGGDVLREASVQAHGSEAFFDVGPVEPGGLLVSADLFAAEGATAHLEYDLQFGSLERADIKSGSNPSAVQVCSPHGRVPVVVFGSDTLDASAVEPGSLRFLGMPAAQTKVVHVDADGQADLKIYFDRTGIADADTLDAESPLVTGTQDGAPFAAANPDDDPVKFTCRGGGHGGR